MLHLRIPALLVLLFVISACAQASDIPSGIETSNLIETQTSLISSSPVPADSTVPSALPTVSFSTTAVTPGDLATGVPVSYPTSTPSSTPLIALTLTSTPTAAVLPSDFSPVLLGKKYDADMFFTLLGGVQGGRWLAVDQAAANITGASAYDVYAFGRGPYQVFGYVPEWSPVGREFFLSTDAALNERGMVGVAHGWQVRQAAAEELASENEVYRQVIIDWLSQAGVSDPQTGTMHIYRIDLESDGTDEIFISDTRVESQHTVKPGDHSVILMRKVSGSGAVTIPILVDLYAAIGYGNPFPCSYSVANFVDLNQDGVLEIVVEYDRWEGFGASVYQVRSETVEQVLGKTCINP